MNLREFYDCSDNAVFIDQDGSEFTKLELLFNVVNSFRMAVETDDVQPSPYLSDFNGYAKEYILEFRKKL